MDIKKSDNFMFIDGFELLPSITSSNYIPLLAYCIALLMISFFLLAIRDGP